MQPFDLVIVGYVAVTGNGGRTGKGGGFADLELGIFREMGLVKPDVRAGKIGRAELQART